MVTLYLGWFYRAWIARLVTGLLLVMLAGAMILGENFGPGKLFSYAVGFGALAVMIFCVESGAVLQREIESHALRDHLTGVFNRRGFSERFAIEHERSRRLGTPLWVAMIDFGHLKQVNDDQGHAAGDQLLRASVLSWQKRLNHDDLIGRFGGDEFVILLPNRSSSNVAELLDLLRQASAHDWSWGVAEVNTDDLLQGVLSRADAELYRWKANRRA
jgi:diguanylate cyclase (GGDEF)-like protein